MDIFKKSAGRRIGENMDLQERIDRHVPLNSLEGTLKYLFLNNIPLDQIDYDSKVFQRNVKAEKGLTHEETIRKFRRFITAAADNSYMTTDMYIPKGRSLYIRKFPRYLIDNNHFHKDALEINVVLQGEFYQKVNGNILRLSAGDICFMAPGVTHATRACDDNTVTLSIMVYQSVIKDLMKQLEMEKGALQSFFSKILLGTNYHPFLVCRTGFDDDLAGMVLDMEVNQDDPGPYIDAYMKTGLELFLLRLLMKHSDHIILGKDTIRNETDIQNLMDYIEVHYKTVTLNSLAAVFGYSPGYLSVLIKDCYGRNFSDIIAELKLSQATKLLLTTDYSMTAIAETVGYSDKSYFLRCFKKHYGLTPSEYKKETFY